VNRRRSRRLCESAIADIVATFRKMSTKPDQVHTIYERCIDFGGHPNERALTQMLTVDKGAEGVRFEVRYLTARSDAIAVALKTASQSGVFALRVFQHVLKERFALLGVSQRLDNLQRGL
jgi:hypothetical protein